MNWAEKYRPKSFEDLIISNNDINTIKKWMSDKHSNVKKHKNSLILHGPPGVGKTSIAHIILHKYGYDVIEFNSSDIKTKKELIDNLNKINGNLNVLNMMSNKKKKMAVIIDELDGINDKSVIKELSFYIKKSTSSPFIFTTNSTNKKIDTLKTKSIYIKINKPSRNMIKKFIQTICKNEKIEITNDILTSLINTSQLDFRRTINLMEYIFSNKNNEGIKELIDNYDKKTLDNTIYEATDKILSKYNQDFKSIFDKDKTSIGYTIYENFSNYIINNRDINDKKKLEYISTIYNNFSIADMHDKKFFINQNFTLSRYIEFLKCNMTSFYINTKMKKMPYNKFNKLNYSTLINKISHEYLNSKNIIEINKLFDTSEHIYICDFIYLSIINDRNESLIRSFNLESNFIEKICKLSLYFDNSKENTLLLKTKIKDISC